MSKLSLIGRQCLGIFYRNYKLNKLMIFFMILFLGIEYFNLRNQKTYTSVVVLVNLAIFLTTFQSIIVINFANDRSKGFLDLYASMGLLKTPYILCQLVSFSLVGLLMQTLMYLMYFLYHKKLDSILPENFGVCLLFMISLMPMVLIFSLIVRSPNYSRGLVTLVNIFMYIYGFSYAWDNTNESFLALLMPHYHYSNFIITFYRNNPQLRLFLPASRLNPSYFSLHPKTSMTFLFLFYLIVYIVLEKVMEELDGRFIKFCGKMFRKLSKCFKKKKPAEVQRNKDTIKIESISDLSTIKEALHWNNPKRDEDRGESEKTFKSQSHNYLILRNIWKYFSNFPALAGVNIALKKGEITCLLGHNGAGKSTLINILTGFLHPSNGEILWNNKVKFGGVNQSTNTLREVGIGICTSKDILYESMTVFEHLRLAGLIKGIKNNTVKINEMIQLLNLEQYINMKVGKLSGGCKRKLSIGIALIGDPQIVFLDEPTSALDPVSRREILEMLAKLKVQKDKIILLTTHHLEEAELLSDFVVVLSRGKAVESGSLHQLKKKFSVGNFIKLSRKDNIAQKHGFNFEKEKKKIFSKVSEQTKQELMKLDIEQIDALSITIKSGNLSNQKLNSIIGDLENNLGNRFYIAVNSCTFDDIFREIDKIYEQGSGGGNEKEVRNMFKKYATFIKGRRT